MGHICLDFSIFDPQADLIFTFVDALKMWKCGLVILWEVIVIMKTAEIFITFEDLQTNEE